MVPDGTIFHDTGKEDKEMISRRQMLKGVAAGTARKKPALWLFLHKGQGQMSLPSLF